MGNATSAAILLTNNVATPKGGSFSASWTLGALMVEVLGTGDPDAPDAADEDKPLAASKRAASKHLLPPAPRTDAGAAILAAVYCLGLIVLMAMLSKARVGVIAPNTERGLDKSRSGNDLEMQGLLAASSMNGVGGGGGGGGGAGVGGGGASRSHSPLQNGGTSRVSVGSSRRRLDGL